jgi:hypothetical protein
VNLLYTSGTAYNGYVYIVGGYSTGYSAASYYAPINGDGSLGTWLISGINLPATQTYGSTVAYNGYLYSIGGYDGLGSGLSNHVYYSKLSSADGSIGAWSTGTSSPYSSGWQAQGSAVVNNGYIYITGGVSATNTVYYSKIAANGSIGTWVATTNLPVANNNATLVVQNGYVYQIAGSTGTNEVYFAPMNADGSVGAWASSAKIPFSSNPISLSASVAINGYIYELGGKTNVSTSTVYYASLNSIPRIAHYSYQFNFGSSVAGSGLTANGSPLTGTSGLQYRLADSSGVYGSLNNASSLVSPGGNCPSGTTQYLQALVTIDDSQNAAFPDYVVTPGYVTDVTVSYGGSRPAPNLRLHGGKSFQNEALQPLDTCGP